LVRSEEDFEPKERLHRHIQVNCNQYCKKIANISLLRSTWSMSSGGRRKRRALLAMESRSSLRLARRNLNRRPPLAGRGAPRARPSQPSSLLRRARPAAPDHRPRWIRILTATPFHERLWRDPVELRCRRSADPTLFSSVTSAVPSSLSVSTIRPAISA
jgi:hypothetical protein